MVNLTNYLMQPNNNVWRMLRMTLDAIVVFSVFQLPTIVAPEITAHPLNYIILILQLSVLAATIAAFYSINLYRWRLKIKTLKQFLLICVIAFSANYLLDVIIESTAEHGSIATPLKSSIILIIYMVGIRLALDSVLMRPLLQQRQPVAIYGTSEAGQDLHKLLKLSNRYFPLAFINEQGNFKVAELDGLSVYHADETPKIIDEYYITGIIIAIPSVSREHLREILSRLTPFELEIKIVQSRDGIFSNGEIDKEVSFPGPLEIFGRPAHRYNEPLIKESIENKTVLVTGISTKTGVALCKEILKHHPRKLVIYENHEKPLDRLSTELRENIKHQQNDITIRALLGSVQDKANIKNVLQTQKPDTIFHCPVYLEPTIAYNNKDQVLRENSFGTKNIAEAASEFGVKSFTLISINDAMQPPNIVAASLRLAELICQVLNVEATQTNYSTVRVDKSIPNSVEIVERIETQIKSEEAIFLKAQEAYQFLMLPSELAQLIIQAGALSSGGEIFVLDMGEPINLLEVAQTLIRIRGYRPSTEGSLMFANNKAKIQIQLVEPQDGETLPRKLYGNDPEGTAHPRILKTTEAEITLEELKKVLDLLERSCHRFDFKGIDAILSTFPICAIVNEKSDDIKATTMRPLSMLQRSSSFLKIVEDSDK